MSVYMQEQTNELLREEMQKGYMEMAWINLKLSAEAFVAEEEAEDTLYRLVSGV